MPRGFGGEPQTWDDKLRPTPTVAKVLATLASGGPDAVMERWGGNTNSVMARARYRERTDSRRAGATVGAAAR